jgi:hypothetical protein
MAIECQPKGPNSFLSSTSKRPIYSGNVQTNMTRLAQSLLVVFLVVIGSPAIPSKYGDSGWTMLVIISLISLVSLPLVSKILGMPLMRPRYLFPRAATVPIVLFITFLSLYFLAYIRAAEKTIIGIETIIVDWVIIGLALILAFLCINPERPEVFNNKFPQLIYHSVGVYVIVNVLLSLFDVGVHDLPGPPGVMLDLLGFSVARRIFPMAGGVNSFGAMGGAAVLAGFAVLAHERKSAMVRWGGFSIYVTSGVYVILYCDMRSAAILTIVFVLLSYFSSLFRTRNLLILLLVSIFTSVIYYSTIAILPNEILMTLSRPGLDLFSNRHAIWDSAVSDLVSPSGIDLIGYGLSGQVTSGIFSSYTFNFQNYGKWTAMSATTLHNLFLQTIYNVGYIGIIIFVALLSTALSYFSRTVPNHRSLLFAPIMLCYFLALGATESIPTPHILDSFIVVLLLLFWMVMRRPEINAAAE